MRGNDFLNKMENVDPAYIEAAELSSKKKTNSRSKWGALVACLCLVVLGAVTMLFSSKMNFSIEINTPNRYNRFIFAHMSQAPDCHYLLYPFTVFSCP